MYSCGLLSDGRLECWGKEEWASAGVRDGIAQFDLGSWSGCAVDVEGFVDCWCGNPSSAATCGPDQPTRGGFLRVLNGEDTACAEDLEHRLHCWGYDNLVRGHPDVPVDQWDIDWNGGCAVIAGEISCWGTLDKLWDLSPAADPNPPTGGGFVEVSLGTSHGCALGKDGEARCWGSTGLADPFPAPPPGPFVHLESYHQITCGFRPDDRIECWYYLPGMLDEWSWPEEERWAQLGLGGWDACGLTVDGRALCFPAPYESYGEQQVPDLEDL